MLWGVTPAGCLPWLKHRARQVLFREAVLAFLGAADKPAPDEAYCQACRQIGEADCATCDRRIEVVDG